MSQTNTFDIKFKIFVSEHSSTRIISVFYTDSTENVCKRSLSMNIQASLVYSDNELIRKKR